MCSQNRIPNSVLCATDLGIKWLKKWDEIEINMYILKNAKAGCGFLEQTLFQREMPFFKLLLKIKAQNYN